MLDFDWNQMRTNIPAPVRVTSGQVSIAPKAVTSRRNPRVGIYARKVMTLSFGIVGLSLLVSFALHTLATSISYKVQLAKLEVAAQMERNSRLQMSLDNLVSNQQTSRQLGLSEFSTPERITTGGR